MLNKFLKGSPLIGGNKMRLSLGSLEFESIFFNGGFRGLSSQKGETQKASGIMYLQEKAGNVAISFPRWAIPRHILFDAGESFFSHTFNYPVFARPCPVIPRHGFVDSIVCNDEIALNALSLETQNVESEAELLITKPIDSCYSAILNGGVITFARGNDGATSGKGCKYFYISEDPLSECLNLSDTDIVAEGEVPFYEFVLENSGSNDYYEAHVVNLVQVRSAPSTPRVKDYVPNAVEVLNIIKAEGDLLDWESALKSADPKTTIIDHTDGSLSSHYAIHAIVNNIPIFTSYLPPLGSFVEPTVEDTEINKDDEDGFFRAFVIGFCSSEFTFKNMKYRSAARSTLMGRMLELSLCTLHNFSSIALSKDYEVLGIVLGMFCKTAFAVSYGESRYGRDYEGRTFFPEFYKTFPSGRGECYNTFLDSPSSCISKMEEVYRIFNELKWGEGYGGAKWASCTKSAIGLFNACINREIPKVVELFNIVINEEHNGGKYLNKVISTSHFDRAARNPSGYTLKRLDVVIDILHTSWDWADVQDWEKFSSDFKEISCPAAPIIPNLKPVGYFKTILDANPLSCCKNVFLGHGNLGKLTRTIVVLKSLDATDCKDNYSEHKGVLKKGIEVGSGHGCPCVKCCGVDLPKLYSVPYWWVSENGTPVISKQGLKKFLKEGGYTFLPTTKDNS